MMTDGWWRRIVVVVVVAAMAFFEEKKREIKEKQRKKNVMGSVQVFVAVAAISLWFVQIVLIGFLVW